MSRNPWHRAALLVLLLAPTAGMAVEEPPRELIHLSRAQARDLLGCTWGDSLVLECRSDPFMADRAREEWGQELPALWHDLCRPEWGFETEVRPFQFQTDFWNLPADPRSGFFLPVLQVRFTRGGFIMYLLLIAGISGLAWFLLLKPLGRIVKKPAFERRLQASTAWLMSRVFRRDPGREGSGTSE